MFSTKRSLWSLHPQQSRPLRQLLMLLIAVLLIGLVGYAMAPQGTSAAPTLISQGKTATASSAENASFPAPMAVDGNLGTRWASAFSDPQWLQVDLGASYNISRVVLNWEPAYGRSYQIQTSGAAAGPWTTIYSTTTGDGGVDDLTVSGSGRYIRMYGTVRATQWGYSLWEFQVYGELPTGATATRTRTNTTGTAPTATRTRTNTTGTGPTATRTRTNTTPPAGCSSTNSAIGKTATASSALTGANLAIDNNLGTRWESVHGVDPQWIYVDMGSTQSFCRVRINWEPAYATAYQVQTASSTAGPWTNIYTTTSSDGGVDDLAVAGSGRYLRVHGTTRALPYGYSIWELEIYTGNGTGPTATSGTGNPTPTRTRTNTTGPTPTSGTGSCSAVSNIALNKPAYSEYYATKDTTAAKAVDGSMATRWDHLWYPAGPATAWVDVDLGATNATITRVRISWEAALAADYQLQTSNDRISWSSIHSVVNNAATTNDITISPARTGRYLRVNMTRKGTAWGYSFFELEIYGCNAGNPSYAPLTPPLSGSYSASPVWSDEFDGTALNTSNWGYDNDAHNNGEQQQYTANNVTVSGGTLKITARRETVNGWPFTSGRIFSKDRRTFKYGRMVARMRMPVGEGFWPAFWMMGQDIDRVGWPGNGELDIMENIGYANWSSGALHGPGYWGAGSAGGTYSPLPAGYNSADWHEYIVEWDPTYIRWYLDSTLVLQFTRDQIITNYGQWTYENNKFFILNLALGGDYPAGYNGCNGSPLPAGCPYYGMKQATVDAIVAGRGVFEVDYVRVYQKQ